ncbi:hypothetical protein GGX14DRAFT_664297 [Mycena pura]|uniref:Uncharacterized protein n=1 Tax=Mycena pura TaxID=153505 RepID=A0AAD7E1P7_9AGAR|nr:hypothetical protein GGX14DRAFT_664297 [Mycena pura]
MNYPGYRPVPHPQLLPDVLPPGTSDTLVNRLHLEAGIVPASIAETEALLSHFPPGTRQYLEQELDALVVNHGGSRLAWVGAKPELLNNYDGVVLFPIPATDLAIRVFPGDLHPRYAQFFFDLYDRKLKHAVNSPPNFRYEILRPVQNYDLVSIEEAMGITRADIRPGEERFSVPEGTRCCLKRQGVTDFYWEMPKHPKVQLPDPRFTTSIPFVM